MKTRLFTALSVALILTWSCSGPSDGVHRLTILTTNDVHGAVFDSSYVDGRTFPSMVAASALIDSVRAAEGRQNVLLLDAGDFLQGDNCVYFFNYVDTLSPHLCPRLYDAMRYDAVVVGNHDVESGHKVFDRVMKEFHSKGIPFLAANAVREDGSPYFDEYALFRKAGLKVLVLGFTNANMKAWLSESVWRGLDFLSLLPYVQEEVDRIQAREKPDVTVVAVHSGTGRGDGGELESQGLDLLESLKGVDVVACSHDHRPFTVCRDSICLINSGSRAQYVAQAVVELEFKDGQKVSKTLSTGLLKVDKNRPDTLLRAAFRPDFEKVRNFTLEPVAILEETVNTRDAFAGMSSYMDLIHTVQLHSTGAEVSIAAPLSVNRTLKAGQLVFHDMFALYAYENRLCEVRLSGSEIRNFLEYSYDSWIQYPAPHVLKIAERDDPRTGQKGWSFVNRTYNFDSAAGINYTVDVTRPFGQRVKISSLADGTPFEEDRQHRVAMNSYRASAGSYLKASGKPAGPDEVEKRIVRRLDEVRNLIYEELRSRGTAGPDYYSDRQLLGSWYFVPREQVKKAMDADMLLLFK
ncbi:MAG: bifunctional metallophosphatase/5'-nucleotidase [Bacteroidales bacterium]|nr:bifunctional metallophosphatase/5'-nucleotidase [Bacteroidales bacterium]